MADALVFPRLIYRGAPDTLGQGQHVHPDTGVLVGETKRVDSQEELDEALKDGWRMTSKPSTADLKSEAKAEDKAKADESKGKK
jgi:hypothetical protein